MAALDWIAAARSLDEHGYATIPALLTPPRCAELAAMYDERERFRSRVVMERVRFGVGEYKYFAAPLPPLVAAMRAAHLSAPRADRQPMAPRDGPGRDVSGRPGSLPGDLPARRSDQADAAAAPLRGRRLQLPASGPLWRSRLSAIQLTCLLSRSEIDFSGGEFLLVENRPRAQSRGEAVALEQGEAIIFATSERPIAGSRGHYRVTMRHGVSRVREGRRLSLGIIFHDAK